MSLVPTWSRASVPGRSLVVLAIADSAPRARFAATMLDTLPGPGHAHGLAVLRSAATPSPARIRAELEDTRQAGRRIPLLTTGQVRRLIRRRRPDAVLLDCSGPHTETLSGLGRSFLRRYRPVVVSSLPVPAPEATEGEWLHRSRADLLVAHSHREVDEYTVLAEKLGIRTQVGLAGVFPRTGKGPASGRRDRVVFAAEGGLPDGNLGRETLLLALADLARNRPDLEVVLHLGHEDRPEPMETWHALARAGRVDESALTVTSGALRRQLDHARGLVALGSEPVLVALSARVPCLVLTDFGRERGGLFEDSGLLGDLGDLRLARFHKPRRAWGEYNHFHPASEDDWVARLHELCLNVTRGRIS
ncbi:DUF6716 putative glycosyltransferase [Nocardiopsis alba]